MNQYECESNSRRIVEMFQRSIEAQSRIESRESKIILQDEKRLVIESSMNWISLESIISGMRSKLYAGEEFWGKWPGGTFDSRISFEPMPAPKKERVREDEDGNDDDDDGEEWKRT